MSVDFKIDKNIKQPTGYNTKSKWWPFNKMSVGDSFLVGPSYDDAQRCRSAASQRKIRSKSTAAFTIRKTDDGYRCWRIA